jgi:hypothetical protein
VGLQEQHSYHDVSMHEVRAPGVVRGKNLVAKVDVEHTQSIAPHCTFLGIAVHSHDPQSTSKTAYTRSTRMVQIWRFPHGSDMFDEQLRHCQPCEGATAFGKQSPGRFKCLVIQFNRKLIMRAL